MMQFTIENILKTNNKYDEHNLSHQTIPTKERV
jgi:hypothetical protein